jgi:hypothetical protein
VHEDLSNTVQRSKDELIQHETNHDWLRTAVGRRDRKSGIEMERRKEGFVVDKQTEGCEGECEVELCDSEKLGRVGYMISFRSTRSGQLTEVPVSKLVTEYGLDFGWSTLLNERIVDDDMLGPG